MCIRDSLTTLPVRSHRPDQASTVGLTKRLTVPSANHLAGDPTGSTDKPHEQCSQTTPPNPRAKRGKAEPMQDFQARQVNCSPNLLCIRYLLEIPVWLIILAKVSNAPPNPRHDRDSKATQCTRPDHRPGGHQPSNQPWVPVRSQWSPSRHDLKSAPLAGWEINLPWTTTVPRYNLKSAL